MSENNLVSILILSWNRAEDVLETLHQLSHLEYPAIEIIVVDNGSTDHTPEKVAESYPEVKVISLPENIGIEACNVGFSASRGEYIVILDDDSFPRKDAIRQMVTTFENDETIGVVAFAIHNSCVRNEKEKGEEHAGTAPSVDKGASDVHYSMGFNGAGAGFRRKVLDQVGFYPGEFFLYMNEMDLSFRVLDAGYRIYSPAHIIAYHKFSPQNRVSWRAPFYYTRNTLWLLWKNYPASMFFLRIMKMFYLIMQHTFEQRTFVYLKALLNSIKEGRKVLKKRKPVSREIAESMRVPLELSFTFFK